MMVNDGCLNGDGDNMLGFNGHDGYNNTIICSGWWYTYPSEKYEFISWDDDITNIWKATK